jgi:hypothetical protein
VGYLTRTPLPATNQEAAKDIPKHSPSEKKVSDFLVNSFSFQDLTLAFTGNESVRYRDVAYTSMVSWIAPPLVFTFDGDLLCINKT